MQSMLPMPGRAAYKRELALLQNTVDQAIEKRRSQASASTTDAEDFLGFLLEEQRKGAELSTSYIRNELVTLLFAGHDTTTSTLLYPILIAHQYSER